MKLLIYFLYLSITLLSFNLKAADELDSILELRFNIGTFSLASAPDSEELSYKDGNGFDLTYFKISPQNIIYGFGVMHTDENYSRSKLNSYYYDYNDYNMKSYFIKLIFGYDLHFNSSFYMEPSLFVGYGVSKFRRIGGKVLTLNNIYNVGVRISFAFKTAYFQDGSALELAFGPEFYHTFTDDFTYENESFSSEHLEQHLYILNAGIRYKF